MAYVYIVPSKELKIMIIAYDYLETLKATEEYEMWNSVLLMSNNVYYMR